MYHIPLDNLILVLCKTAEKNSRFSFVAFSASHLQKSRYLWHVVTSFVASAAAMRTVGVLAVWLWPNLTQV